MSLRPSSDKLPCFYSVASIAISLSVEEAEAAAESGDDIGDRVRLGISAAVLLSAAVRSADDAALANKARIVLASGDAVVSNDSVPAALQEALAMVLEAKKQLACRITARPSACQIVPRFGHHRRPCRRRRVPRFGAGGHRRHRHAIEGVASMASDATSTRHGPTGGHRGARGPLRQLRVLLRRRAPRRLLSARRRGPPQEFKRHDGAMDDVFVEVTRTASAASRTAACRRTSSRRRTERLLARRPAHPGMWYDRLPVSFSSQVFSIPIDGVLRAETAFVPFIGASVANPRLFFAVGFSTRSPSQSTVVLLMGHELIASVSTAATSLK